MFDLMSYEVSGMDIDSTCRRARVKTYPIVRVLNTYEIKQPDAFLYRYKSDDGVCHMNLESSLR